MQILGVRMTMVLNSWLTTICTYVLFNFQMIADQQAEDHGLVEDEEIPEGGVVDGEIDISFNLCYKLYLTEFFMYNLTFLFTISSFSYFTFKEIHSKSFDFICCRTAY